MRSRHVSVINNQALKIYSTESADLEVSLNFSTEILLKVVMSDSYSRKPRESAVKFLLLVASGLRSYLRKILRGVPNMNMKKIIASRILGGSKFLFACVEKYL